MSYGAICIITTLSKKQIIQGFLFFNYAVVEIRLRLKIRLHIAYGGNETFQLPQ